MLRDHSTMVSQVGYFHKKIGVDDKKGFFHLAKLCQLELDDREDPTIIKRCDNGKFGPYGFHQWDSLNLVCSCGSNDEPDKYTGHHELRMENLAINSSVITFYPHIMIQYFELKNPLDEEKCCQNPHSESCRTLQEIFRLILEWHYAYLYFDNREEIAIKCHNLIEENMIPENIQNWILNSVPPQKVERFLMGDPSARIRKDIDNIQDLSQEFDNWLESKILSRIDLNGFEDFMNSLI